MRRFIWCATLKLLGLMSILSLMAEIDTAAVEVMRETWNDHNEFVTRVYLDDHVAIYYDDDVNKNGNITWPFEFITNAWKYVKEAYGPFGPDPLLYVIFHATKYSGCHTSRYHESEPKSRNQIDCGENGVIKATPRNSRNLHNLLYFVGDIIIGGEKMTLGQRDEIIGGRGMLDILWYDLIRVLKNPTQDSVSRIKWKLERSQKGIYWFRDWFLPIYEQFGGVSVLKNFVNITNRDWQETQLNDSKNDLTFGEFVHFWSGAAHQDLYPMAKFSINNSKELYAELVEARKSFPFITYTQTSELKVMKETWNDHNEVVMLVYQDEYVAIYYDEDVNKNGNIRWPFEFISKAWKYTKETYGSFGPDPLLYVILHATKYDICHSSWYREIQPGSRNQIDCGEGKIIRATPWDSDNLHNVIYLVGDIIVGGEKMTRLQRDKMIGGRGMLYILYLDLTLFLKDPTEYLATWKKKKLKESTKGVFWFRDWYLPIYEQFGGTSVLQNFVNITNRHWQNTRANPSQRDLNLGEFVHIWSGAAHQDLYPMAKFLINNSKEVYTELVEARKSIPFITYTQTSELKVIRETWNGHDEVVTLVYQDDHVAIYYDREVNKNGNITWPFEIISNAWKYVKETYGPFGPDPLLYVIIHSTKYIQGCHTKWYRESEPRSRNQMDCAQGGVIEGTPKGSHNLHIVLFFVGEVIVSEGKMTLMQGDAIIGERGMLDIWWYDLTLFLKDPTESLATWKDWKLKGSQKGIFWFRDWFLPIYEQFGGTSVLKKFVNISNHHVQKPLSTTAVHRNLNLGEFVHFWSGAAHEDLLPTAIGSINNSQEFYDALVQARKTFFFIDYTSANCDVEQGVIRCDESATCRTIARRCNGKKDCSDGSDEANCTACRNNVFECARGGCVENWKVCDKTSDCPFDDSDENNCTRTSELKKIRETWNGHKEFVTLVYQDDHVAIYYDEEVNKNGNITWPFEIVSNAWKYVKETYGPFGPDPLLYVILHSTKYIQGCHTKWYRESEPGSRNQIDCAEGEVIEETPKGSHNLHIVLFFVGEVIVGGDEMSLTQRDATIGGQGMLNILYLDLTLFLKDPTEKLVSWKEKKLKESTKGVFWFRDWYLPIYEQFGTSSVLRNFVNITNRHWQEPRANAMYRNLSLGELVHFWSGAAHEDLLPTAVSLINNSLQFYAELVEARKKYSFINYTRAQCDARQEVVRCDEGVTCKNIAWRCNGKIDCSDGSDEVNCKTCKSSAFECKHGGCVEKNKVCDYTSDCPLDKSDENNCTVEQLNPKIWSRTWRQPPTELKRVHLDEDVVVYLESGMNSSSLLWVFEMYSQAWAHVKDAYGIFAKNPRLGVVLRLDNKDQKDCDIYSSSNTRFPHQNVIDCGRRGWALMNHSSNFQYFVGIIAKLIRAEAKGIENFDSIDTDVCGNIMELIIVYDLIVKFKETSATEVGNWKKQELHRTWNGVHFFQDWFLPIYENYGGSTALGSFYRLAKREWGKGLKKTHRKYLNVGEFVHFWSGAAGADLLPIALQLFNDSSIFFFQLVEAKKNFPSINYTATPCRDEQFKCEDLVCIREIWQCNGMRECGDESDEANCTDTSHLVPIVVGILALVLFVASVGLGVKMILYRTRILKLQQIRGLTNKEVIEFLDGNLILNKNNANSSIYSRPFISDYEIPQENLVIDETYILGSGEFGIVKKGKLLKDEHSSRSTDVTVAVKMVKPNAKVEHFKAFLKEIKIMAFLGQHQNIVSLLGTVTSNIQNCKVFVAVEFCSNGDLLHFLRENCDHFQNIFCPQVETETVTSVVFTKGQNKDLNPDVTFVESSVPKKVAQASLPFENLLISTLDLLEWSRQIADGMNYLTTRKVIHGDLAARNVLLTGNKTAKISDFGLSHQLVNYEIYRKASKSPLPWRWLAIESISSRTFSVHSDVWAFGVTLWEIFTLGKVPYPERSWDHRFINDLSNGLRLNSPKFGNDEIYNLMMSCMEMVPAERVPFSEISLELQRLKTSLIPENYLASTSTARSFCIYSVLQKTQE